MRTTDQVYYYSWGVSQFSYTGFRSPKIVRLNFEDVLSYLTHMKFGKKEAH